LRGCRRGKRRRKRREWERRDVKYGAYF